MDGKEVAEEGEGGDGAEEVELRGLLTGTRSSAGPPWLPSPRLPSLDSSSPGPGVVVRREGVEGVGG